ncbi:unnamed protein product [Phytophthora fragariaefolia]|uniref:Unnamed protein product n=1 Tax=Phytophthora fragariaefolia TaxID=1490495 RepID=A0A9W7CMX6_9STRA|nr:unnamed protein product [Phytophthora fragariaefolia]
MKRAPSATGLSDDGDEKMEEAETTTVEVESYAQKASQAVWKVIEPLVPGARIRFGHIGVGERSAQPADRSGNEVDETARHGLRWELHGFCS